MPRKSYTEPGIGVLTLLPDNTLSGLIFQTMLFKGKDWFTANSANSSRVDTPNLSKILLKWCLTVSSLILKYSAISLFEYPATTAATISSSRGVRPNFLCRASSVDDCTRVRRYCTRLDTLSRPTQYSPDITVWIAFSSS